MNFVRLNSIHFSSFGLAVGGIKFPGFILN